MDKLNIQLLFYILYILIIVIVFIWSFNKYEFGFLFIFTCWSITFSLLYYVIMLFLLFFQQTLSKKFDSLKKIFLKKIFKIIWTFNLTTLLGFWGGVELNWINFEKGWDNKDMWLQLFLHGFIPVIIIIDTISFDHVIETSYQVDVLILSILFWLYAILFYINKHIGKNSAIYIYTFNDEIVHNFVIGIVYYMLYINMYFAYQFILMKKMNIKFAPTIIEEKTNVKKRNILIQK